MGDFCPCRLSVRLSLHTLAHPPTCAIFYWVLLCPNSDISLYLWGCCVNVRTFPCSHRTVSVLCFHQFACLRHRSSLCRVQIPHSQNPYYSKQPTKKQTLHGYQVFYLLSWHSYAGAIRRGQRVFVLGGFYCLALTLCT